jgi:hypothetical protein
MTPCALCEQARLIWSKIAGEIGTTLEIVDIAGPGGQALMSRWALKTVPAVLIDGSLRAVGVQREDEARKLLSDA